MPTGPSLHLSGRLADSWTYSPIHPGSSHKDYRAYLRPRYYYQHRSPHWYLTKHLLSSEPPSIPLRAESHLRKMYNSGGMCSSLPLFYVSPNLRLAWSAGSHGKLGGHCSLVQDAYASTSTPFPPSLPPTFGPCYQTSPSVLLHQMPPRWVGMLIWMIRR